ncbi:MCSP protein, partial [Crocuta crocuta]
MCDQPKYSSCCQSKTQCCSQRPPCCPQKPPSCPQKPPSCPQKSPSCPQRPPCCIQSKCCSLEPNPEGTCLNKDSEPTTPQTQDKNFQTEQQPQSPKQRPNPGVLGQKKPNK